MNNKRALVYLLALIALLILVYLQFRTWQNFDWATFWYEGRLLGRPPHIFHLLHAIGLIYIAYVIRAVRWAIFLRPVRPKASALHMVAPTFIGFTALALLGRPGELIRPYLIAHRENLSFSSQLAVWAVERIFDVGAFTVLVIVAAFSAVPPAKVAYYGGFRQAGVFFTVLVATMIIGALAVSRRGEALANWVEAKLSHRVSNLGHRLAARIREFRGGLNTIHGARSFLELIATSMVMWFVIGLAYKEVTHSFGNPELEIPQKQILLLMGASMMGSTIQLPGVGGGSQLATIAALEHIFGVRRELAASCGIMLWLVTFVAVIPVGLAIAHRERLSFRRLSQESRHQEEADVVGRPPT